MHSASESFEPWKWEKVSKVHKEKFEKLIEHGRKCPDEIEEINGVRVCFNHEFIVGKGGQSDGVYVGLGRDGSEKAVKLFLKATHGSLAEKELELLMKCKEKELANVVGYWFLDNESDRKFAYLIMELCEETLENFIDCNSLDNLIKFAPEIIQQILKGLAYLHREPDCILHRDVKPRNILRNAHGKWLLADFGIGRILSDDETTHMSVERGTKKWKAIESCSESGTDDVNVCYKTKSDIQVTGMVAFYILTKGEHPFGENEQQILTNLLAANPVNLKMLDGHPFAKDLISWMLSHDAKDRPSAEEALQHPYLKSKEQQFNLLCGIGNEPHVKKKDANSDVVKELNKDASDWRTQIDKKVLTYLSYDQLKKISLKYTSSWTDCLRLIRNIKEHWKDCPRTEPQAIKVGDPQEYFLTLFPDLVLRVYKITRSCDDLKELPGVKEYFRGVLLESQEETNDEKIRTKDNKDPINDVPEYSLPGTKVSREAADSRIIPSMAESVIGAVSAVSVGAVAWYTNGGDFSFKIEIDNVTVNTLSNTAIKLGALYFTYKLLRPVVDAAVKKALGGERDDQEVRDIKPGSLHVLLHCLTDERFLEVLADYESGRMKERLREEFSNAGIEVKGLKVEIENLAEVNETKEAINKRNLYKDVKYRDKDDMQHDKKRLNSAMMKPLPKNKEAFLEEANSLGLLGPNPSLGTPRAKLLKCIQNSMKIKRSFNHVSILLAGPTGVGKSSTVNHLLGVHLAGTGSGILSETRSTKEFLVHDDDPKYEVEGLSLGLIDTPGFSDTDGHLQDACNFLSIQKFFRTHPTLSGCYPNLVFLVMNATDHRLYRENSDFGKSLRIMKQLGIVDPKNPNVVAILTHACSIRKRINEEWTKELDKKKTMVSNIVFDVLNVVVPVVVIENMYDDCGLEHCGDYTRLPNEELQPKNLYLACADVLKNDSLGLITLNRIFVESEKGQGHRTIIDGHEVEAKNANASKGILDSEEKMMVELFEIQAKGDPFCAAITQFIIEQKLEGQEVEEVMKIAGVLRQIGEGNPPDFGSHSLNSIEFILGKEISPIGRKMLEEKFNIAMSPPCCVLDSGRLVGQGYNILTDRSVATQVMKFDVTTKYGIAIPACATFEKVQQSRSFMEVFEDKESYIRARLMSLGVNLAVKSDVSKMDSRAGFNKSDSTSSSTLSGYSFLFEQLLFQLNLGNYKEYLNNGMAFTEDFKSVVAELPSTYDKNKPSCLSEFERFFNRFGHFLVSSAYGGGSVEVKCGREVVGNTKTSLAETKYLLAAKLEGLDVADANLSADGSTFDSNKTKALLERCTVHWEGGDTALHTMETIGDKGKLQKWKDSLIRSPTTLTSELTLEPISTLVGCLDSQKYQATYDALKDLLGGEIKTREKKAKRITLKEIMNRILAAITRKETLIEPDNSS